MTTFGAMVARIADDLGDDTSEFTTQIKEAIVDAIAAYSASRFWFLEDHEIQSSDVTSTTTNGSDWVDWPSSPALVRLDTLRLLSTGTEPYGLIARDWSTIDEWSSIVSTGVPTDYAVRGESVRLYPTPNSSSYTLYWTGLFRPTVTISASGDDNQTNVWMTTGSPLIRARARGLVKRDHLSDMTEFDRLLASDRRRGHTSPAEAEAYAVLKRESDARLKTGRNRAHGPGSRRWGRP